MSSTGTNQDVVDERCLFVDGRGRRPVRPGLGVELRVDLLSRPDVTVRQST
jgi:hypothetical protein